MRDRLFDDLLEIRHNRAAAIAKVNDDCDRQEAQVIALIRAKGLSWEEIGQALGVTRQAAWERYGRKVEE